MKPIYFSLDWEILSETRLSYNFGWKNINTDLENLFSHVNTIELLNFITINNQKIGDYSSLFFAYENLPSEEQKYLINKIKELTDFYKPQIENLGKPFNSGENWSKCEQNLNNRITSKNF